MKHSRIVKYLGILSVSSVCVGLWAACALAGPDLFVGNFLGDANDVLRCNATTGAFIDAFVASGSGALPPRAM